MDDFFEGIREEFTTNPKVGVTIEVPKGDKKPYWDKPCHLNYGYIASVKNPNDGDPLDVYLFNYEDEAFTVGQIVPTMIFGFLFNNEGGL